MAFSSDWHRFTTLILCLQFNFMGVAGTKQICTALSGGNYTLTNELRTKSQLIYHCPPNYYPYPDLSRVCLSTGTWKPRPTSQQTCMMIECPDPHVLAQGTVYPVAANYYVGQETYYECSSGYNLQGPEFRVCQSSGKWNGTTPICIQEDTDSTCADPGVPAGTSRNGMTYDTDDKVTYSCKNNLILVGSRERVCQENGQWTGREPTCYYKYTYDTAQEVSAAFGASIKTSLTELQPEDTQTGRKIRIPKNGILNIYIAIDISGSISKEDFLSAKEAVTKLITKVSSFSVNPNYEILFFSAKIIEIVNINLFFGAEKPTLNHVRQKLESFQIEEGGTDDLGTDLDGAFARIRLRMAWIKQNTNEGFVDQRHVIIVFTDGGFNSGGSPIDTVAKIKHMVYHNKDGRLDEENRKDYLDIYIFAIGSDIFDEDLMPLTAPERSKDQHYFRLAEMGKLEHVFADIIDEQEVVGLCGLYIEKDRNVFITEWAAFQYPWMVEITIDSTKCIGSLVSSRFVLTAAHCINYENTEEDITVYTSDKQVKKVKSIHYHPDYDLKQRQGQGVLAFFDYDVVLLKLTEDLKLSSEVRPICIPCTQATSDALKLVGVSTCRQQEERLLNQEIERLTFLNVREDQTVHEKDVRGKFSSKRPGCIAQAKYAYGVPDNFTLAVTDNFICTGGEEPNIDYIACKGDSGGAVFKEYENRMIQVGVVSWGVFDMCATTDMPFSNETSRDFHINLFRVVSFLKDILGNKTQFEFSPIQFLNDV